MDKLLNVNADGNAGGIVTFVGTPRAGAARHKVQALYYEAYEDMSNRILDELVFETQVRWPVENIILKHRLGRVNIGEPSVVLRVAAQHRYEAFRACEFLIDRLKHEAPIWKKEMYEDGNASWVHCRADSTVASKSLRAERSPGSIQPGLRRCTPRNDFDKTMVIP